MGPAVRMLIAVLDIASCLRCLIANNVPHIIPAQRKAQKAQKARKQKGDSSFSFKMHCPMKVYTYLCCTAKTAINVYIYFYNNAICSYQKI